MPPHKSQDNGGDTTSVSPRNFSATSFGALADELIAIVHTHRYLDACDKIAAILDSIHCMALQEGERRGIERGMQLVYKTNTVLLEKLLGGK